MAEEKQDILLSILIVLLVLTILGAVVFYLLKMIVLWIAILIPGIIMIILVVYIITKHLNDAPKEKIDLKRPELVDIIQPMDAWTYVKTYFQQQFGIMLTLNNDKSYMKMKTVGQEGYETKIYSFFAESQNHKVDIYHVVLPGHNPQGLLFLKNETNPELVKELEEGVAVKSQRFITEIETHEDELSGRRITKKKTMPLEDNKEPEPPKGEPEGNK